MQRARALGIALLIAAPQFAGGQTAIRQASYPDSLVTVKEFHKACQLFDGVLAQFARDANSELATALADQRDHPLDPQAVNLVNARRVDSANAAIQLATWTARADPARQNALSVFCKLDGPSSGWSLAGFPTRHEIKSAAATPVPFVPQGRNLGASGFTSFLGIDEGHVVGGIAKFLVDRAATEIQLAFLDRITRFVCDASKAGVFDASCHVLSQNQLVLRSSFPRELRSAFEQDLRHAPRSVPLAVISSKDFKEAVTRGDTAKFSRRKQDLVLTAYAIGTVFDEMTNGADPLTALLATATSDPAVLRASDSHGLLVDALSSDTVRVSLPVSAGMYRLLLGMRILPDADGNGQPEWPGSAAAQPEVIKTLAVNLRGWLPELGITTGDTPSMIVAGAAQVSKSLNDTYARVDSIRRRAGATGAAGNATLADYASLVDDVLGVAETWATFIEKLHPADSTVVAAIADLRTTMKGLAGRDYVDVAVGMYGVVDDLRGVKLDVPKNTEKFLSFMTAATEAENAGDFAKALESFAAPVQSYRAKRHAGGIYLTLNGYLGGNYGYEKANGIQGHFGGVFAPIGLEAGVSVGGFSLGFLTQILDVGTPASYRIRTGTSDTLAVEPEVGFAQVVSPGYAFVIGLPRLPITVGYGRSVAPQLRKMPQDVAGNRNATRSGVFIAVDIPLFAFR